MFKTDEILEVLKSIDKKLTTLLGYEKARRLKDIAKKGGDNQWVIWIIWVIPTETGVF